MTLRESYKEDWELGGCQKIERKTLRGDNEGAKERVSGCRKQDNCGEVTGVRTSDSWDSRPGDHWQKVRTASVAGANSECSGRSQKPGPRAGGGRWDLDTDEGWMLDGKPLLL